MNAVLRLIITQTILWNFFCAIHDVNADHSRLSKFRPRTLIFMYNATDTALRSTFTFRAWDGKPVSSAAHYPNFDTVINVDPFSAQTGLPIVAELARNKGIEMERKYDFVETIDLPGLGPVLELRQHLVGNPRSFSNPLALGSKIQAGFAAPSLGVQPVYFDDQEWHRMILPVSDIISNRYGEYVIDFCFYGAKFWSDAKSQLEKKGVWQSIKKAVQGFTEDKKGVALTASAAGAASYTASVVAMTSLVHAAMTGAAISGGTVVAAFGLPVVLPALVVGALGAVLSGVPSAYDNLLYKIEFVPRQP